MIFTNTDYSSPMDREYHSNNASDPKVEGRIDQPIAIDSRIKTFIYSENEVFRLVVHYGYQTSIEFAEDEEIQTISAGNNYAWQLKNSKPIDNWNHIIDALRYYVTHTLEPNPDVGFVEF